MENQQKSNRMNNVIFLVMIAFAAFLSFHQSTQAMGKSSSGDIIEFRTIKPEQNRRNRLNAFFQLIRNQPHHHHHHHRNHDQDFYWKSHSSNIPLPKYIHNNDKRFMRPFMNSMSSSKAPLHSNENNCFVARFDALHRFNLKKYLKIINIF